MQPIKHLSHLYSMRKLFLILFLFGLSNSFAQNKLITPHVGIRPIRGELRAGLLFNINEDISIGPEYGRQIYSLANDNYYFIDTGIDIQIYNKPNDLLGNVFILEKSHWFGLTFKQLVKSNSNIFTISFSPYFLSGINNHVNYTFQDYPGVGPDQHSYKQAKLKVRNYGVESMIGIFILNKNKIGLELTFGGSIFIKNNSVYYKELIFESYYGNGYYESYINPKEVRLKRLDVKLQTGLNLVF